MSKVENIILDISNEEFYKAAEIVEKTNKNLYLTGKAGTGKTTFLKYIINNTKKNHVVVTPTGVAAINAGGTTIHSFFQLPFSPFTPDDPRLSTTNHNNGNNVFQTFQYNENKKEIIEKLELLIIDEVSMVRADTIDVIDKVLRVFRKKSYLPFGGVQVIFIGDTFQLAPIARNEEWQILSNYYQSPYFFSSRVFQNHAPLYIELKKIYRQSDYDFKAILNSIRTSNISPDQLENLNARANVNLNETVDNEIVLTTHNKQADNTNQSKLQKLSTELFSYDAEVKDNFNEKSYPTNYTLNLKVGAQVMTLKNKGNYYNGKIGVVKELSDEYIIIDFEDCTDVTIEKHTWENVSYKLNPQTHRIEETVNGTFTQFPVKLAWAITIHKSQGLTFEKVRANLNFAFAAGQVYVALSRCTSLEGIRLESIIGNQQIITDPKAIEFATNETPLTLLNQELNESKADFLYKSALDLAFKGKFIDAFETVKEALENRNDINTNRFAKAITILDYKRSKQLKLLRKYAFDNLELKTKTEAILHEKNILTNENNSLKLKINYRDKKIKDLEANLSTYRISVDAKDLTIRDLKKKLHDTDQKYIKQKIELKRLKEMSWFDRLINRKLK